MASKTLSIILEAQDRASKTLKGFSKQLDKAGISQEKLTRSAKIAGTAITAFGVALGTMAVKSAVAFEKSMANINTLYSDSGESVKALGDGIKKMMKTMPKSAEELGASAYAIVSAGISDTGKALETLEASGKLAVAGLGTTEEATKLVTVALNAFAEQGLTAQETANILFKTVRGGITTVGKMSQAFGKMAGNAVSAGIGLEDVQAATAALTTVTGQTSESQNALAQVFLELTKAGGKLDKELKANGGSLDALNVAISEDGLVKGMDSMRETLGLSATEFKNMFSSAEGGTAVFALLTSAYDKNNEILDDMLEGMDDLDIAFEKQKESVTEQWELFKNSYNTVLIALGDDILPSLIKGMDSLSKIINQMNPKMLKFALAASLIVGPLLLLIGFLSPLVAGFKILATFIVAAASATGLMIIAIVGIVAAIVILITKWDWFKKRFSETFPQFTKWLVKFKNNFKDAFDNSILKNFGQLLWDTLNIIVSFVADSIRSFLNFFKNIGKGFRALGKALKGDFSGASQDIKDLLEDVTLNSREAFNTMLEHSSDFASGVSNNMSTANQSIISNMSYMTTAVQTNMSMANQSIASGMDLITTGLDGLPPVGEDSGNGVGSGLSGGIGSGVDEAKKKLEELGDTIADLLEKETQLRAGNNRNNLSLAFSTAEAFVNQEEKVDELRKQLASETDNIKKGILKEELRREEEALDKRKLIEEEFSAEISEVKRRAALTDFDRTIEDILKKRIKLDKEYQDKLRDIVNELKDNEDKRDALLKIQNEITTGLVIEYNKEADIYVENQRRMIAEREKFLRMQANSASSQMSMAPVMSPMSNMSSVEDAIITPKGDVITTHPDDYIIATKNPQNLGGKGNITININGGTYLSEEVAEEIGDMIISKLQTNIRV